MDSSKSTTEDSELRSRQVENLRTLLGPEFLEALQDPATCDIFLNPDGTMYQTRSGHPKRFLRRYALKTADAIVRNIASLLGRSLSDTTTSLDGEFPIDGSRIVLYFRPQTSGSGFTLRRKPVKIFTLDDYVAAGSMLPPQKELLRSLIAGRKNILVAGGTGSGKTTLLNALIQEMVFQDPMQRFITLEDTGELLCTAKDRLAFYTTGSKDMQGLLKDCLRSAPDRILIGEIRDQAALDMLDAWNTGHEGGAATLHANSAGMALRRLESLVHRHSNHPPNVGEIIGDVIHAVVHITRTPQMRRISEILLLDGYRDGRYVTHEAGSAINLSLGGIPPSTQSST